MAKSIRNIKKNWPTIKRDFKDLMSVATTFESTKGLLGGSLLYGTLYAVVGTGIFFGFMEVVNWIVP